MEGEHHLAVHLSGESVRGAGRAERKVIVDFTVDDRDRSVLTNDGLRSAVKVQNRQPRVSQSDPVVAPDALTVRATVALKAVDAVEHALIGRSKHSTKTAHMAKSGSD